MVCSLTTLKRQKKNRSLSKATHSLDGEIGLVFLGKQLTRYEVSLMSKWEAPLDAFQKQDNVGGAKTTKLAIIF